MNLKLLLLATIFCSCTSRIDETTPVRRDVTETVYASGFISAKGLYNVTAKNAGYLEEMFFEVNEILEKGAVMGLIKNPESIYQNNKSQVLFEISRANSLNNSPSVIHAKTSIDVAMKQHSQDSLKLTRYQKLMEAKSIARIEYEDVLIQFYNSRTAYLNAIKNYETVLQEARKNLIVDQTQKDLSRNEVSDNKIKAVFGGKVYKKLKEKGDFVQAGEPIALMGDPTYFFARVNVDEGSIRKISIGQKAVVKLNSDTTSALSGSVVSIAPVFDEQSQSFSCEIHFDSKIQLPIINTPLQANIIIGETTNALLIPRSFLHPDNTVSVKGLKNRVQIQTKWVSTDWVQVIAGLDDNVVLTRKR